MIEIVAGVVLAIAYGLLWRHAVIKGRRLRAAAARLERARAARAAFQARPHFDLWAHHYIGMAIVRRPDQRDLNLDTNA